MWLKRIELKNFKRLVDFQAQFNPGVNVVKGPLNEMGKSTLLDGIVVALFHNPKSTAKELKDYVSWGSTRQCQTSLEFEDKGNRYLLEKDFDKGTIRLIDDNTREELDTFKEISEKMAELLGTKSDKLFLCSSCIRQTQVSEISSGKKEINESLEEVVSGGKEGTLALQVIQKLNDKISEIRKGLDRPVKIPGSLASLRSQLEDFSQRYNEVRDEVSKVEAQKIELMEVNKQLAQVKEEYENARVLLEKNRQRKDIETSIKGLKQKYDEVGDLLDGIDKLMTKLEKANEALKFIEGLKNELQVSEFKRRLDAIQIKRKDIENSLDKLQREVTEAEEKLNKRKSLKFLSLRRSVAIAAIISIGGIVGILIGPLYLLSLIILGMAFLAASMRATSILARDRTKISDWKERIQTMNRTLGDLSEDEKNTLTEARCSTIDEYNERERDFKIWLEEKRSLENQLKGMVRGKTVEDFQKQKRDIARDLAVEQANLTEDLIETHLSPEEYIELERKVQRLEATRNELEDRKRDSMAILKAMKHDAEEQVRLEEELEGLQKSLKHEERKGKVYELAREFISKARTEVLSSVEEALEKEIQRYLAIFTNDRYKQVRVNKEALEFGVYSDEKGDWVKPEDLSGGVIDEFYLAFRLALAKLIFGDKKPPLILDDPFVNFDSVRLANTLDFFKTLASDYQIIIFTLSDLYDKVADNIILLGEKERPL
jgi:DNA repair exonuclease SbcCD ATPase subunit